MVKINRRVLIGATGATIALAACGESGSSDDPKKTEKDEGPRGFPENYGENPNFPKKDAAEFGAQYIGIIDIRPSGGWQVDVNHAAFFVGDKPTDGDRFSKAIAALEGKRAAKKTRFSDLTDTLKPYNRKKENKDNYDSVNFDDLLGFKSQNELFIFIEGDVELAERALLSFTPLGFDLNPRDPNFTFFDARMIDKLKHPNLNGRMISVKNYQTDEKGQPIINDTKRPKRLYSMNIHFTVKGKGGKRIPMIIDPDTGNGAGNEP